MCPCTGGVIVTQDFLDTLKLNGPENTKLLGTVTAIYDVGCFFGAVAAFSLGERLGRKKTILLGTTVHSILRSLLLPLCYQLIRTNR